MIIMSEKELDEILKEVRAKAGEKEPLQPPAPKSRASSDSYGSGEINSFSRQNANDYVDLMSGNKTQSAARSERRENQRVKKKQKQKKLNAVIISVIAVIVVAAVGIGIYFGFFRDTEKEEPPKAQGNAVDTVSITNPLTGEPGYSLSALEGRPVAVVVENEYSTEQVRPQWGLNSADIVLEGESEYSTRLLLFWADYSQVPDMVGPVRSARPPFIRFSQLFDSVFLHAGLSQSKGNYVGADEVFASEDVDHINLLDLSGDGEYFGRNNERNAAVEHTGYLNGTNLPNLLDEKQIRTEVNANSFSALTFNKEAEPLSALSAVSCSFNWSASHCPKTAVFTYNNADGKYTTSDFDSDYGAADVKFENLIFLFDETEYIVKENYGGSGNSETYCDYKLSGGTGTVLSHGTALEIKWGVTDGKLWLKKDDGSPLSLNPGKSYIGYGSSNNGGKLQLNTQSVN